MKNHGLNLFCMNLDPMVILFSIQHVMIERVHISAYCICLSHF